MKRRSIANRLALATGAVALGLLVVGTLVFWPLLMRATQRMVQAHVHSLTNAVAASYQSPHIDGRHLVGDALDELSKIDFVQAVQVRDASGSVRHRAGDWERPLAHSVEVHRPLTRRVRCAGCHGDGQGPLGEVWIRADADQAGVTLLDFHRLALWALVVSVVVALLMVTVFARRMVAAPIDALASAMSRAEEGDFLVRAPTERHDEIGHLAQAFNKMLAAITDLQASRIEQAEDLALAQHELELREELSERNEQIAETNARLSRRVEELTLLTDLTAAVTSSLELRPVLDELTRRVGKFMAVDEVGALLVEPRRRRLKVMATYGVPDGVDLTRLRFKIGEGISGRVAQAGRAILVRDTRVDERYLYYKGLRPADGSFLSVPMIAKGKVLGVLDLFRAKPDAFDEQSVTLLSAVAGQAALAIENARLYKAQTDLALTDPLTGLLNRRALDNRLEDEIYRAVRFGNELSALMIDIDHFKRFNDQHGHLLGDHVLKQVARTLRRHLRKVDTLARFGGEEFCVLLVRTPRARAIEVAEKLRAAVEKRTYARIRADLRLSITISVGVAERVPEIDNPQALLDAADGALYMAKRGGRNRVVVHGEPGDDAAKPAEPAEERVSADS